MCTAVTYKTCDFYFGRTLDYECSFGEEISVTPRYFPFHFRNGTVSREHFAMIGMAHIEDGYPLYYDGANEKGLCMAGLNFVDNACYKEGITGENDIAVFELIPWILGKCSTVVQAKEELKKITVTKADFNEKIKTAQLHWIIADKKDCITLECTHEGTKIYDNPVGVLTNNPTFDKQLFNLNNYMHLSAAPHINRFSDKVDLKAYSRGMGAIGLPGDLSSMSRFVRCSFTKLNSVCDKSETSSVGQLFHILGAVEQVRGCCRVDDKYEITIYTSCINADKGIYYYTTYDNRQITAINMNREKLDGDRLLCFPIRREERIKNEN